MAMPSTYLTLEQLRRMRSRERGDRFNAAAQQASQAVRMGLDDLRKERERIQQAAIERNQRAYQQARETYLDKQRADAAQKQRDLQARGYDLQERNYNLQERRIANAEKRAQMEAERKAQAAAVENMAPGMVAEQRRNLEGDGFVGGIEFDVSGPEPVARELNPQQAGELDAAESYKESGVPEPQAEALARQATEGARASIAKDERQRAADEMAKAEAERKARLDEARIGKIEADTAKAKRGGKGKKRASITPDMQGRSLLDASKGGKPLGETQVGQIATYRNAIDYSNRTKRLYDETIKGSGIKPRGKLGNWINDALRTAGMAPQWKRLIQSQQIAVQLLGRASEGGKLADADYIRYQEIFGNPETSTAEEFENAMVDVGTLARNLYDEQLFANARASRDVSSYPLSYQMDAGGPSPQGGSANGDKPKTISASDVASSQMLPDGRMEMTLKDGRRVRVKPDALSSFVVGE